MVLSTKNPSGDRKHSLANYYESQVVQSLNISDSAGGVVAPSLSVAYTSPKKEFQGPCSLAPKAAAHPELGAAASSSAPASSVAKEEQPDVPKGDIKSEPTEAPKVEVKEEQAQQFSYDESAEVPPAPVAS